ncbi:MAG: hypothetical protein K2L07_13370 [Lachnospiraceae bacterium]|nr:hypothetical protein [Lachnospiraceae bacterium]
MEQFGEFTENINNLESSLTTVRAVWIDQTAMTYDEINENMKVFVSQITAYKENSIAGFNAVKANYNEVEFENELNQLGVKVAAV